MVEDALKKSPNNPDLEEELGKAREEMAIANREKEEAEAEQKLAEVTNTGVALTHTLSKRDTWCARGVGGGGR